MAGYSPATFCGIAWAAILMAGCGPAPSPPPNSQAGSTKKTPPSAAETTEVCPLIDRAAKRGIEFTYRNGSEANLSTILESLGGGLGWIDYDRDGQMDLLATGGGQMSSEKKISGRPCGLFRAKHGEFMSVGASAGIESTALYSHGVAIADYDNDGFQDFLVTGYGRPQLWHNMGDGTFLQVDEVAGFADPRWSSSAGWADFDGDGRLDLYLARYVNWSWDNDPFCESNSPGQREICPPRAFEALPHSVYLNQGDGTFLDASESAGLRRDGKGLGVLLADIELDGDVDVYVGNDTTDNFLYINNGRGKFEENGVIQGVALDDHAIPNGSMGVELCDFNHDGLPDLWVTNYERESNALYRNQGKGQFLHVSQRMGITDLGGLFVGFGTACEDFDADGDQDIVVANGHVIKYPDAAPRRQLPLLLLFDGQRFKRAPSAPKSYFGEPHEGRGVGTCDFDADGDIDVAVSHVNEPLALLENEFRKDNRWISLNLIGTQSNRDAVGSRIELQTSGGKLVRQIVGGGSYLSHHCRSAHFALPDGVEPQTLTVRWPSGSVQSHDASSLSGSVALVEPRDDEEKSLPYEVRR